LDLERRHNRETRDMDGKIRALLKTAKKSTRLSLDLQANQMSCNSLFKYILNRLLTQLQDLEDMREDLDDDEYESTKEETLEQMKVFEISLNNMVSGNIIII
jgi:hypothetical protein